LGNETIRGLGALGVKRIAYVSGEAETLAKDAKRLAQAGYVLKVVQPIDLAPQTYYTDMVGLFEKK
jgi:23S rRNA (uracil1939-C5)-methyltransferase